MGQYNEEERPQAQSDAAEASEQAVMDNESAVEEVASDVESQDAAESADAASLKQELQEAREQVLRAHAEMQNVRRRAEQDVEKAHKFALERFSKELLPVVDSLEKALEAASAEGLDAQVESIREGVDMTLSLMSSVLGKFDVMAIEPLNQPFNPELHEAMSMVPQEGVEPNTVIAVLQKGYTLNGRLIRPAMVMVSRAP